MAKGLNLGNALGSIGSGSLFGKSGSDASYEMTTGLLQAALSGAQESDSPLLAFLTPIAATMIGRRAEKNRSDFLKSENDSAVAALLGSSATNPKVNQALTVLNSETAPDYLKTIANTMLKDALKQVGFGARTPGTRARQGSKAGDAAPSQGDGRLVGEVWIDGVLHGRDRSGTLRPYRTEDGNLATKGPGTRPAAPATPSLPADPLGLNGAPENDPLGIR
jgi:hypothetical protein